MRRRQAPDPQVGAVPADLAAGPCVEIWGDGGHPQSLTTLHTTCGRWHDARDVWMRSQGLDPTDCHRMPPELRARAPYSLRSVS